MSGKLETLLSLPFPVVRHSYTARDVMLYALGLGLPRDPLSASELRYVYEDGLAVLPTFAVVAAHPGFWVGRLQTGLDATQIVHGEQTLRLHRPLPVEGTVTGHSRIVGVADKGPAKGAVVYYQREIMSEEGDLLVTVGQALFCRGDGGLGSGGEVSPVVNQVPDRAPEHVSVLATSPRAALLYRLSGDYNPLHAAPDVARRAGFPRPILHGLATYGVAGLAVIEHGCAGDAARLASIDCRFRAPVYPGDQLETSIWVDGDLVRFQTRVPERDQVVLSNGQARLHPGA
jgi:acyl dehydratase